VGELGGDGSERAAEKEVLSRGVGRPVADWRWEIGLAPNTFPVLPTGRRRDVHERVRDSKIITSFFNRRRGLWDELHDDLPRVAIPLVWPHGHSTMCGARDGRRTKGRTSAETIGSDVKHNTHQVFRQSRQGFN